MAMDHNNLRSIPTSEVFQLSPLLSAFINLVSIVLLLMVVFSSGHDMKMIENRENK